MNPFTSIFQEIYFLGTPITEKAHLKGPNQVVCFAPEKT